MTTYRIRPSIVKGRVQVPSSKSMGHRLCLCAGLAGTGSIVDNIALSQDIEATHRFMQALGIQIKAVASRIPGRTAFAYDWDGCLPSAAREADCGESGSTLRFCIPLGALCNVPFTFRGQGQLVSRPLEPYYAIFRAQGLTYQTGAEGRLPLTVNGRLRPGNYTLPGDVSSQFISGLLFALPLLEKDSLLTILPPLESAAYIGLTLRSLARFGIQIRQKDALHYKIPGKQRYQAGASRLFVEGDWSQAAFWLVAGTIGSREGITCCGLDRDSLQGDKAILTILSHMGADIIEKDGSVTAQPARLAGCEIDASDCPDLVPVLTVAAAVAKGTTHIIHAGRLRIKECDRLNAMATELNALGANIQEEPEGLLITGLDGKLPGGERVDAHNDHRVAMSLAVAALACREPIVLTGAESVAKSYPGFWQDYLAVGGRSEIKDE